MNLDNWLKEYERAYSCTDRKFDETTKQFLLSELPADPSRDQKKTLVEPYQAMIFHIFQKSARNESFGEISKIKQRFGLSLEENYGMTSGLFLSLAYSYWTFKLEMDEIRNSDYQRVMYQVLASVEFVLASTFFPTSGLITMPKWTRKITQRAFLEKHAPEVNVEDFFSSNPYFSKK